MPPLPGDMQTAAGGVKRGSLAQLVEQWTFNPLVPRSSRGRSTISKALIELIRAFFIRLIL